MLCIEKTTAEACAACGGALPRSEVLHGMNGFTEPVASAVFGVAALASFFLLAEALQTLPVGTGYAVWTGIGAVGAAIVGIVLLGESTEPLRIVAIALVAVGIVMLGALSPG